MKDVKERNKNIDVAVLVAKTGMFQFIAVVLGAVMARTTILGSYSPFGVALTAAVPGEYTIASAVGVIIGCLLPGGGGGVRYIIAVIAVVMIKWALARIFKTNKTALLSSAITFAALMASASMIFITDTSFVTILSVVAECLLASASCYFLHRSITIVNGSKGLSALPANELSVVAISLCVLLMGLSTITIGPISPARILAVVIILAAARYGKETGGAIAGVAAGFSMALTGTDMWYLAGAYAFGGLIAGVFSRFKRIGVCTAFILAVGVVSLREINNPSVLTGLYEVFAATVIFLVLPDGLTHKFADLFSPAPDIPRTDGLRAAVVSKLSFASHALQDVSLTVDEVSGKLKRIDAPNFDDVFTRVENSACKGCGMRVLCYETHRGQTLDYFVAMTKIIRKNGYLQQSDVPREFQKKCARKNEVMQALYSHFTDYLAKETAAVRLDEVRMVINDQFNGIADMLSDMSTEFAQAERFDIDAGERVDSALRAIGIQAVDIACKIDRFNRMTVEIRVSSKESGKMSRKKLLEEVSIACDRDFDLPGVSKAQNDIMITLSECANYKVEFGAAQFEAGESRMCGDAYECFCDGKGRAIMIVSDGMGSGGRAAVDGAMASGLMSRLIKAGFGFDCSLKIVNSSMLFKSTHESLATLDVASIDLFTGKTELLKAGAPATIVRRNGRTGLAECASMPAGILRDIGFDRAQVTLSKKDIVLLMSDGATCEGTDWICAELETWKDGDANELAEHIAVGAKRRRTDGREDDITVVAAIIDKAV